MRICDKCGDRADFFVQADNQSFDLCGNHHKGLLNYLTEQDFPELPGEEPKRKRGRPPKNPDSIN